MPIGKLQAAIEAFFASRQLAPSSRAVEGRWLELLDRFCGREALRWERCIPEDLQLFHQELLWTSRRGRLYSVNTIDSILRTVRAFYRWAQQSGLVLENPANWTLPRPVQPQQRLLGLDQALRLLNLPNLTSPLGQRDQVLLELLYFERLRLLDCLHLKPAEAQLLGPDVQPHLRLYLENGRPQLARDDQETLLLSRFGTPFRGRVGLRAILLRYSALLGLPITARLLHQSGREHFGQLAARRFSV